MAVPNRTGVPEKTSQTDQYVLNYSFDEVYRILMVGLAAYNPTTGTYDRVQLDNATGGILTAGGSGGGGSTSTTKYIVQTYNDGTYDYYCKALPGTALSAASWQVMRLDSSSNVRYAGGSASFTNAATNVSTVQGYTYS